MARIVSGYAKQILALGRSLSFGVGLAVSVMLAELINAGYVAAQTTIRLGGGDRVGAVRVTIGKSSTLRTDSAFVDLVVGDPNIADVMPLTDRSLYVLGKKVGTTNISIYDADKRLVGVVEVEVAYHTNRLAAEIARRVPGANVQVNSLNGRIMLSGSVPSAVALDEVLAIAKQFAPDVINSLSIDTPQQVLLEVRFIEVSRSAARELGIKWNVTGTNIVAQTAPAGLPLNNTPFGVLIGTLINSGVKVDVLIQSLENQGLARRLAEPNLVALSGEKASFLAGGEFPFPVAGTNNTVTIEFKKFGVGLTFTPTVLSRGVINLKIEPEVSQLDTTTSIRVGGVEVPSLIVRRASTVIELRDGQSFAVAGLLQSVSSNTKRQLPWLGEIPIIGALFRSASFERNETDLAIIVTPRLVKPARPGERLRTPFDTTVPGNDPEFFLLGKGEISRSKLVSEAGLPPDAPVGHFLEIRPRSPRNVSQR